MNASVAASQNCPHCESILPNGVQFCPHCGQSVATNNTSGNTSEGSNDYYSERKIEPTAKPPATPAHLNTLGGQATFYPSEAQPQEIALEPGDLFANRYEIQRQLGQGGMGSVYLATDSVANKQVAIKILNPQRVSQQAGRQLIDEGILARDIRHPNVIAVYDSDVFGDRAYLTMEYLEGMTLRELLRRQQVDQTSLSFGEASQIILQILSGLEAAHQAGVIHRDLKPENIMVQFSESQGLSIKILDFGIAKLETQTSESPSTVGTMGYMSPEQFTSADLVNSVSDLYSLSVIYYELLVGALPRGHWQPPSQGRPETPVGIDQLIEQGLSNRASSRPQSAADYRQRMENSVRSGGSFSLEGSLTSIGQSLVGWNQPWKQDSGGQWWSSISQSTKWVVVSIVIFFVIVLAAVIDSDSGEENQNPFSPAAPVETEFYEGSYPSPFSGY